MRLRERLAAAKAAAEEEALKEYVASGCQPLESEHAPDIKLEESDCCRKDAACKAEDDNVKILKPICFNVPRTSNTRDKGGGRNLFSPKAMSSDAYPRQVLKVDAPQDSFNKNTDPNDEPFGQKTESANDGLQSDAVEVRTERSKLCSTESRPALSGSPFTLQRPGKRCKDTMVRTQIEDHARTLYSPADKGPRIVSKDDSSVQNKDRTQVSFQRLRFSTRPSRVRFRSDASLTLDEETQRPTKKRRSSGISRGDVQKLRYIKTLADDYRASKDDGEPAEARKIKINKIRSYLHKMMFFDFLTGDLVKESKVLEYNHLGHMSLNGNNLYPSDVRNDASAIVNRWLAGRYDPDLLKGIITVPSNRDNGTRAHRILDNTYHFRRFSSYFGEGLLNNGDWWPFQICCVRDGAHGEIEAGISGDLVKGAFSIVLSGCKYKDIDRGGVIEYCSTRGTADDASVGTKHMLLTYASNNPIRVLRSHSLPKANKYRPVKGIRYDGLYKITGYTVIDDDTSMHRFRMERERGQSSIRYQGVEKRPTPEEVTEYDQLRFRMS